MARNYNLNLGFTISDILLQRNVSVVGCEMIMQCCRFLSAYMGHARYEDTLYYVHMVPDFYERVGTVDRTAWEKLLPEVHDEGYAQFFAVCKFIPECLSCEKPKLQF